MTGSRLALGVELGSGCVMHDSSRLKIEIFDFGVRISAMSQLGLGLGLGLG